MSEQKTVEESQVTDELKNEVVEQPSAPQMPAATKPQCVSPILALVLSIFPGLGHLYLGLMTKGILLMVLFALSFPLADVFGPAPAVVFFYAAFDAMHLARLINKGQKPEDLDLSQVAGKELPRTWQTVALGIVFIAAGLVILLKNLGIDLRVDLFWPFLPIGIGVWLIVSYWRRNGDDKA